MFRRDFHAYLAAGLLAALSPAAASAQTAAPARPVPTAADFGALPTLTTPLLAPDGTRVAARGVIKGKPMILVIDVTTPQHKTVTVALPERNQLQWLRWAGNERILISLSRVSLLFGSEVRFTRLAALDLKTGEQVDLGPQRQGVDGDNIVFVDPAGSYALLSTQHSIYEYPTVYRVDLATGKSTEQVHAHGDVWAWYADSSGTVRVGMGSLGAKWWMLYRSDAGGDFQRTEGGVHVADDKDVQQVAVVPGSDQGYAVADGRNGHLAVYRYDFKADRLGDLVYENPGFDVDDYEVAKDGTLLSVAYTADHGEIAWFDPEFKALQARIDRALPGAVNRIVSMSADRKRMLILTGSASDPGAYYLYDRAANTMDLFAETHQLLAGKRLSAVTPVHYKARDGLDIPAYLTLPEGHADKDLPLVVMPHGGPFARDSGDFDAWAQYLASRGYAVLQPNFRGSTGFGRAFVEKGYGQFGRGMQDDIDDGVKWLAARGTVDAKRVCIMGASFGGYAAMWAAVRNPELYRCAISLAGISDVSAQLKYDRGAFVARRYFRNWRERVQGDQGFELDQISPLKAVDRLTVPILIAHGEDDNTVPVSQSQRLHDALQKLHRPHEFVVYPGEGHGFTDPVHSTDFLTRVGAFLDKYNPS